MQKTVAHGGSVLRIGARASGPWIERYERGIVESECLNEHQRSKAGRVDSKSIQFVIHNEAQHKADCEIAGDC